MSGPESLGACVCCKVLQLEEALLETTFDLLHFLKHCTSARHSSLREGSRFRSSHGYVVPMSCPRVPATKLILNVVIMLCSGAQANLLPSKSHSTG